MKRRKRQIRPVLPLSLLSLCLFFLGINGLIGGYLMLSDPNGAPMGMPVSDLEHTPFQNFFIPGLLLIFIWGSGSLIVLTGLWMRPKWSLFEFLTLWTHEYWAWGFSILLGLGLIVWLTVQVFTLPAVAPVQIILAILAILLIALPLLPPMRQYYRLSPSR